MNSGLIVTIVIAVVGAAALVFLEMNSRRNARSKEDSEQ
jgi:type II secretory pathway pseudopilin PulG